ncbi:MAG: SCO family protein [Phycisphaeraceae bacterium]
MKKALFNLPVLTAAGFSLAATAVIVLLVFFKPAVAGPTLMLDEPMDVPTFEVTTHLGDVMSKDSMLGKVWVCDFFLSRCNGICPILGRTMVDLASDLSKDAALKDVMLVSFSVDPEYDTLEQLQLYRKINMGAWDRGDEALNEEINRRWMHVRAQEQEPFWEMVREGFKLYVGPSEGDPTTPVAHSGRLVLIDKQGQIRGYYDGLTDEDMPALLADIRRLANESI